jgi:hypothetical protein
MEWADSGRSRKTEIKDQSGSSSAFSYDSLNCIRFEGYKSQSVNRTPLKPFLTAKVVVLIIIKKLNPGIGIMIVLPGTANFLTPNQH